MARNCVTCRGVQDKFSVVSDQESLRSVEKCLQSNLNFHLGLNKKINLEVLCYSAIRFGKNSLLLFAAEETA